MEKIKLWWQKRTPRDRRAIVVLAIVLPVILFWYLITVPMQDRLQMAQRILQTRREEAMQVQKLLQEYSILKSQLDGVEFKASPRVVTKLEESFSQLSASETRPLLNRTNIVIFGQNQPAAQIRVSKRFLENLVFNCI
jgi:type II secretory pathway component PulM